MTPHTPVSLQDAGDFLDIEALDDVADLDVGVVLERHTALEAFANFLDLVLEALERLERAFVDHDVVAQQADLGTTANDTFGDHAAADLAHLGDIEDFANLRIAEELLLERRRKQALERLLHVVDDVIDDRVVADLDAIPTGEIAGLRIGAHIEADHERR